MRRSELNIRCHMLEPYVQSTQMRVCIYVVTKCAALTHLKILRPHRPQHQHLNFPSSVGCKHWNLFSPFHSSECNFLLCHWPLQRTFHGDLSLALHHDEGGTIFTGETGSVGGVDSLFLVPRRKSRSRGADLSHGFTTAVLPKAQDIEGSVRHSKSRDCMRQAAY